MWEVGTGDNSGTCRERNGDDGVVSRACVLPELWDIDQNLREKLFVWRDEAGG
jgi:hypothetical protein